MLCSAGGGGFEAGEGSMSDLLHNLLSQATKGLGVRRAHIATAIDEETLQLVAAWQDGACAPIQCYLLSDTPCARVFAEGAYTAIDSDDDLFPDSAFFAPQPTRGYAGCPIVDSNGRLIGHVCILDDGPLPAAGIIPTLLSLIADRIAMEMGQQKGQGSRHKNQSGEIHDFRALLANLPGMAYRCRNHPDWPMQFVSEGSIALTGYTPEVLVNGQPVWGDLIHSGDRQQVWQSVQDALQQDEPFEIQYRIVTRDNQCKWVWERGRAVGSDQHGLHIEGFVKDISPQRQKEFELERSEAFAKAIVESAAEGIMLSDDNGRIESINPAAAWMLGVREEAVLGANIRDYHDHLSQEDVELIKCDVQQYQQTGASKLFNGGREFAGRRADGTKFPMHLAIRELQFDKGRCFAALIRDISEQKAKEEEIRRQNERLNATVEFSPLGIAMVDKDLRFLAANPAYTNMLGYDESELIGRRFADFTHPDDVDTTVNAVSDSLEAGPDHYSIRKRYLHKDGHTVHVALSVAVGHDSSGSPEFAIANAEDLTTRLTTEAQLKEQQDQLTRLERLSMLGEMTAGIAHEINQPLTAISTYAQSCLRFMNPHNPKPEKMKEALVKLSEQAHRAGAVVERIRELARQRRSESEMVDCSELIELVEGLAETDARSHGIVIRKQLADDLPLVRCDPVQIQQVVLNLIRNAIDSMETGGFDKGNEIIVRTEKTETNEVRIELIDSGMGVDAAVAEDLFRPFSTNKTTGMGLGLSISRSIVTDHGGQLNYYNNSAGGATFYVVLPPALGDTDEQ